MAYIDAKLNFIMKEVALLSQLLDELFRGIILQHLEFKMKSSTVISAIENFLE